MTTYAYNKDIGKWGDLALAILKKDALVNLFNDEGIFKEELEAISNTEERAETADNNQRDAAHQLGKLTTQINATLAFLLDLFNKLRLRTPNVIEDLKKAQDDANAKAASDLDFSPKAVPRLPMEVSAEVEAPEVEEGEDKRSNTQRAVATTAQRLSTYLSTKPELVAALKRRKMPDTFVEALMSKGIELVELREQRVMVLAKQKEATKLEHQAVEEHISARKRVEPTLTRLARSNHELDALLVEHLGRKSLHSNFSSKRDSAKKK